MKVEEIELNKIHVVENVRRNIKIENQAELMQSIKQEGLMQPIGLQKANGKGYFIVWGHRRFLAFQKLGYDKISAVILENKSLTEEEFLIKNITENVHRSEISVLELGRVVTALRDKMSPSEIAVKLAIPTTRVKQALAAYSNIPKEIQQNIKVFTNLDKSTGRGGKLPFGLANNIANFRGISDANKLKVYEYARKEELKDEHLQVLATLLEGGTKFDVALKELKNWRVCSIKLILKEEVYKNIINESKTVPMFVQDTINEQWPNSCIRNKK